MTKQEFIALVKELLAEENLDDRNQDLQLVRREYKYIVNRDEETFFDQDETNKAVALFNELAKKEPKLLVSPLEEKKNRELDKLNNDFRKVGRAGNKEQDDELWNEFRQIKDEFYAKKRAFFEELDKANEEKRAKKENIIERAQEIVNNIKDIRESNAQMDALRKEWKEVGYSGKGDEYLWKDFTKVMDEFQEKKKERHGEMLKLFEERATKKEELIKKARILLANSEFTDEEIEKVKALRGEYKAVGFAGKDKDDDLYQRFNEVIQKYFEEMKFYKD